MWLSAVGKATRDRMRNDQRQFLIYDLEVASAKQGAELPKMDEVCGVWQKMMASGRTLAIRSKTATLLVGAIDIDASKRYATLLVRLSDKMAPNSVYSDPVAGSYEEHFKEGDQGADLGCHVLISLDHEVGFPNLYTCALEKVTGLSGDLVQRLLSKLLYFEWQATDFFTYPHPAGGLKRDKTPKIEKCCPHINLRGRASDKLASDLEKGVLTGVSLVQIHSNTPISGAPYLSIQRAELKLEIDRSSLPKKDIFDNLAAVFKRNSKHYGRAKVSYKLPGGTRQVSVELDASTGAPTDSVYFQSYDLVGIYPLLASSSPTLVPHLVSAAEQQFLAHRTV